MTIKKNGDGDTYIISKWYWHLRGLIIPVLIAIFSIGGAWALVNYKTNQNTLDVCEMKKIMSDVNKDIGIIQGDIKLIKFALGIKD